MRTAALVRSVCSCRPTGPMRAGAGFGPRYPQRGRSPVVHAYEEMTGCTAARCSDSQHQRRAR
eukprot:9495243-Pyramimonas_sp.AAC.1